MSIFSIKDIEALSGIMSHTLRIWEQRYGIIKPGRTDTNIRYYDDEDLKYILNISILNKNGYKISRIAKMTRKEVNEQIVKLSAANADQHHQIKALISAMISFDERAFHHVLNTLILQEGLEKTMLNIVFPFLNEAGILWQIGSIHPGHEHFASNIIKQKLFVAIDGNIGRNEKYGKRFVLFLPEHEQHSLGLLFANYLLRTRGHEVVYLGQQVPVDDLRYSSKDLKPDYVFTLLTSVTPNFSKQKFVNDLAGIWPEAKVLLSGIQLLTADLALPENVMLFRTMDQFAEFISGLKNIPQETTSR